MPYHTPDIELLNESPDCRQITVSGDLWYLVTGALSELEKVWNWEEVGTATAQEVTEYFKNAIDDYSQSVCASGAMFNNANEQVLVSEQGTNISSFGITLASLPTGIVAGTAVLLQVTTTGSDAGEVTVIPQNGFGQGQGKTSGTIPSGTNRQLSIMGIVGTSGLAIQTSSGFGLGYDIIVKLIGWWS